MPDACAGAVSRFKCLGDQFEAELTLDINIDIYPVKARPWCSHCASLHPAECLLWHPSGS